MSGNGRAVNENNKKNNRMSATDEMINYTSTNRPSVKVGVPAHQVRSHGDGGEVRGGPSSPIEAGNQHTAAQDGEYEEDPEESREDDNNDDDEDEDDDDEEDEEGDESNPEAAILDASAAASRGGQSTRRNCWTWAMKAELLNQVNRLRLYTGKNNYSSIFKRIHEGMAARGQPVSGSVSALKSQWHMMLHSFDPDKMDVSGMDKEELQQAIDFAEMFKASPEVARAQDKMKIQARKKRGKPLVVTAAFKRPKRVAGMTGQNRCEPDQLEVPVACGRLQPGQPAASVALERLPSRYPAANSAAGGSSSMAAAATSSAAGWLDTSPTRIAKNQRRVVADDVYNEDYADARDEIVTKSASGLTRWEQERLDRIAKEEADRAERVKRQEAEFAYRREKDEREASARERLEMAKLLMSTLMPQS